jgi:sortase A
MNTRLVLASLFAIAGFFLLGDGARFYAKARVGQFLLQRAWARTLHGERDVKPWSWADTSPIARIDFPRQQRSYIVLNGASGRTMAWGPGHVDGTALPEQVGNCVVSAHRDTQFRVLQEVELGDEIVLETRDGKAIKYRVRGHRVANDRDTSPLMQSRSRMLTLITCYPFDAVMPGGHLRYVVVATPA